MENDYYQIVIVKIIISVKSIKLTLNISKELYAIVAYVLKEFSGIPFLML